MKRLYLAILSVILSTAIVTTSAAADNADINRRACRNYIVEGNKLYKEKRYAEAEVQYQKALQADPTSEFARYNLAATYLRQGKTEDLKDANSLMSKGRQMLADIVSDPKSNLVDASVMEKSFYNLGNMSFNQENYSESIEMYKGALRLNPSNELARQNLRLAQLKLKEQQQNQDKNQDKDKDKNDQNKDQNKDRNKDQNKDENKDKNQDKDKQQQDPKKEENKQNQQPQQQQGGLTDENAAQILKTMENEEAATRRRIQQQQGKQKGAPGRPQPSKPW